MHTIFRPTKFFEIYRLMGVEAVISVAFYPIKPKFSETLEDLFRWMIEREPNRLAKIGISGFCGIGIHPRSIPGSLNPKIYEIIEELIYRPNVVCLGEIGLEKGTQEEIEVLSRQLTIADQNNFPVILHTPGKNKREITKKIVELLESFKIERGVLDHISPENIDLAINSNLLIGLTVQLGKLTVEKLLKIIREYKDSWERFVLNSDLGIDIAEKYSVPIAVQRMVQEKMDIKLIERISFLNAKNLFGL